MCKSLAKKLLLLLLSSLRELERTRGELDFNGSGPCPCLRSLEQAGQWVEVVAWRRGAVVMPLLVASRSPPIPSAIFLQVCHVVTHQ